LKRQRLHVSLITVDPRRRRVPNASIRLAVRRSGHWLAAVSVRTNARGVATFTRPARRGCYSVNIARVKAGGFAWSRVTPTNGFCVS
jgi:hypothetical protein